MRRTMVVVMLRGGGNLGLVYEDPAQARKLLAECQAAICYAEPTPGAEPPPAIAPPEDADGASVVISSSLVAACMICPEPSRSLVGPGRAPVGRG